MDSTSVELTSIESDIRRNKKDRQIRIIRPMPESLLDTLKLKLSTVDFNAILGDIPIDVMVESFENVTHTIIEETFPSKQVCVYASDQPWFNEELRALKRRRLREYEKHGKSPRYIDLLETFSIKTKEAIEKYKQKIKDEVLDGNRGSAYPALRKLGSRPGESTKNQFQLPGHAGFSAAQSAECIAAHFAKISQDYEPLTLASLPPCIRTYIVDEKSSPLAPPTSL